MLVPSDHTFVVCAYKDNPHLEATIDSLKNQSWKCPVIVSTSTPSSYIENVCRERSVPMIVNESPGLAGDDWNYGYNQADTPLVTIAHQDDHYETDFVEIVLRSLNLAKFEVGISFTDYYEIRPEGLVLNSVLLNIKRVMNSFFSSREKDASQKVKRLILGLGDAICCPSVTYRKDILGPSIFDTQYINSCDYKTFVNLANDDAGFLYIPAPLVGHRIYAESATTRNIAGNIRSKEDYEIMLELWPRWLAGPISKLYSYSEKSNTI